jgi:cellulose synthase/poly-beta-1,6-N-acetylglucosamine synthase-like glycosyltransferase
VSVLLPVRDARPTLPRCLASLARQTLADHEVVAVDDGSTDGSAAMLDEAARRNPRIRVFRIPPSGLVAALNLGLEEARSPLVARMDADDVAHRERLARQAERLREDPTTGILGCRVRLTGAPGFANRGMRDYVRWQNRLLDHDAIVREMFVESPLAHPSVMMRTRVARALGGYRAFDGPEDYDLWLRAHAAGFRFGKLAETLLAWTDGPRRLSRTDPRYAPARFQALKIAALAQGPLRGRSGIVIWGGGRIGKSWSRALGRSGHRVLAFVEVDPRKIGQRVHGVPVVALAEAGRFPGALHLAAVGQPGARGRIRAAGLRLGLREGLDLVAVA